MKFPFFILFFTKKQIPIYKPAKKKDDPLLYRAIKFLAEFSKTTSDKKLRSLEKKWDQPPAVSSVEVGSVGASPGLL